MSPLDSSIRNLGPKLMALPGEIPGRGGLDGGSTSRGGMGFDSSKSNPTSSLSSPSCWLLQFHASQLPMPAASTPPCHEGPVSLGNQRPNKLFLLSAFGHDVSSPQQKAYWYTCFSSRIFVHTFILQVFYKHSRLNCAKSMVRWHDTCNPSLWKTKAGRKTKWFMDIWKNCQKIK